MFYNSLRSIKIFDTLTKSKIIISINFQTKTIRVKTIRARIQIFCHRLGEGWGIKSSSRKITII